MLIKSISLENFRCYQNEDVYFSTDPEKNITLITGKNTFGKTTLIRAFTWCLYHENKFDNKILLNNDIVHQQGPGSSACVRVSIALEHQKKEYIITTSQFYKIKNEYQVIAVDNEPTTEIIVKDEDGKSLPITDKAIVAETIESIMPNGLSHYFFFDGETNAIENIAKTRKLSLAINSIMGLDRRQELLDYFDPKAKEWVYSKLENDRVSDDEAESEELKCQLTKDQTIREDLIESKKEKTASAEKLQDDIDQLQTEIETYKEVGYQQEQLKEKEKSLLSLRKDRDSYFSSIIDTINTDYSAFGNVFLASAYKNANLKDKLKNANANKMALPGIDAKGLSAVQKRGVCICGRQFVEGDECWTAIEKQKQSVTPNDYSASLKSFYSVMETIVTEAKMTAKHLNDYSGDLVRCVTDIDTVKKDTSKLINQVKGYPEVGKKQEYLLEIKGAKQTLENEAKFIADTRLPDIERKISDEQEQLKKSAIKCSENELVDLRENYCRAVYNRLSLSLGNERSIIKRSLTEKVNDLFHSIYGTARDVIVGDDFSVSTVVVDSHENLDQSQGLQTMVNFSFVGALIYMAKHSKEISVSSDTDDPDLKEQVFPLVMDAPFSKCDTDTIAKICEAVPEMCNQVIIFVMQKDSEIAKPSFKSRLGKEWTLVQESQTRSKVQEAK